MNGLTFYGGQAEVYLAGAFFMGLALGYGARFAEKRRSQPRTGPPWFVQALLHTAGAFVIGAVLAWMLLK